MSDHDVKSSNGEHAWAAEAMFDYLNNSLTGTDITRFEAHLARCDDCRADLNFERSLVSGMRERPLTEYMPQGSLKTLNATIDSFEEMHGSGRVRLGEGSAGKSGSSPGRWLLFGQAAAIAVLAIALFMVASPPQVTEGYRTLSSGADTARNAPRLQVVFDDSLTTEELRALLIGLDASIVRGPTRAGLFEIEISPEGAVAPTNAVDALRANQHVVFATLVDK